MRLQTNDKGMILPLTLVILIVLSILSISLLGVVASEAKHAAWESKKIQANYLARAGIDQIAEYVVNSTTHPVTLPSGILNQPKDLGDGLSYTVTEFTPPTTDSDLYIVKVTGNDNGTTSNLKIKIYGDNPYDPKVIFNDTLYTLNGTIASGIEVQPPPVINVIPTLPPELQTVTVTMPTGLTTNANDIHIKNSSDTLTPSTYYSGTITVKHDFTIDTGAAGNVVKIAIKKFGFGSNNNKLSVTGAGKLQLYILESMGDKASISIGSTAELEIFAFAGAKLGTKTSVGGLNFDNVAGDPNNLRIYMDKGGELQLGQGSGSNVSAYIFAPEATVDTANQNANTITGGIIAKEIKGTGTIILKKPDGAWIVNGISEATAAAANSYSNKTYMQ